MSSTDAAADGSWMLSPVQGVSAEPRAVQAQADRAGPLLVLFHSKLNGPSRRAEGYLAQVLQRRHNHGTFALRHVDVEERPDLAERFRIENVPTLLVVADRRVQARLEHPKGCRDIEATLTPWLKLPQRPT
jgi:thioredoxin-like negative regulator of GroEL